MNPTSTPLSLVRSGVQAVRMVVNAPRYIYCGFVGRGNLGDEIMYEGIRDRLDLGRPLVALPGTPTLPLRLSPISRRNHPPGVILGGGTLIGRHGWFERVQAAGGDSAERPMMSIGTGVEDPGWSPHDSLSDLEELRRWARMLSARFERVTVRGPRSAATLGEFGIRTRVVGDPALLSTAPQVNQDWVEGNVVINVGASGPIWGEQSDVNLHVRDLAIELIRRGFRVRVLVMWGRDRDLAEALASELPSEAVMLVAPRTPTELMRELAHAHMVVGQRLHSVVVAAAVNTPSVSLAYRPKCLDFQESINRSRSTIRTDKLNTASLVDLTLEVAANRKLESESIERNVARLRTTLYTEIAACRGLL